MEYMLSEKARKVMTHLQANKAFQESAKDIAASVGLDAKVVNGTVTALAKKGLAKRVVVEGMADKVVSLTPEGEVFDIDTPKATA